MQGPLAGTTNPEPGNAADGKKEAAEIDAEAAAERAESAILMVRYYKKIHTELLFVIDLTKLLHRS